MSDNPVVFVIHHKDQTVMPVKTVTYFTRNWIVRVGDNQMHFHGDFVNINGFEEWTTCISQRAGTTFEVTLGGQRDAELMQEAEDVRRIARLAEQLVGLTERFVESNLSHEFKEILKRTPDTVNTISSLLARGVNKALEKLGKGK